MKFIKYTTYILYKIYYILYTTVIYRRPCRGREDPCPKTGQFWTVFGHFSDPRCVKFHYVKFHYVKFQQGICLRGSRVLRKHQKTRFFDVF